MTRSTRDPEPFFGPADPPRAGRRLLLVSWHFPPGGATGALRWQKLAVHGAAHGWGLDVVTRSPDDLDKVDWSRLSELPEGTRVFGVSPRPSFTERVEDATRAALAPMLRLARSGQWGNADADEGPAAAGGEASGSSTAPTPAIVPRENLRWRLWTPAGWIRARNALLDVRSLMPWARDAARMARRVAIPGVHEGVISCGPPHVAHLAALSTSRRTGLPLVLDFRDPWGVALAVYSFQASPMFFSLATRQEARAVRRASLIVTNTEPLRIAMQAAHPRARSRIITVTNGCDESEGMVAREDGTFTISYTGSIYLDRDPRPLFEAVARVARARELSSDEISIELMGDVESYGGVPMRELARRHGIGDLVRVVPSGTRQEALDLMNRSRVLVSLPQGADLAIPSKIFEYMQCQAWILAMATPGSATEMLLRGSGADVTSPDDVDAIARVLERRFEQHRGGERPPRLCDDPRFGRKAQAKILYEAIERRVVRNDT